MGNNSGIITIYSSQAQQIKSMSETSHSTISIQKIVPQSSYPNNISGMLSQIIVQVQIHTCLNILAHVQSLLGFFAISTVESVQICHNIYYTHRAHLTYHTLLSSTYYSLPRLRLGEKLILPGCRWPKLLIIPAKIFLS